MLKNILIIGSTSNFSIALQSLFSIEGHSVDYITTEEIRLWSQERNWYQVQKALEEKLFTKPSIAVYATGTTNPDTSPESRSFLNISLPLFVNRVFSSYEVISVYPGAVMENFPAHCESSDYLRSKLTFSRNLEDAEGNWINLRFNQWYGTRLLRKHLFLGEAINAIKTKTEFFMGSGLQLREFHHIEDDLAIFPILNKGLVRSHINVCHGEPLQLGQLAKELFEHFGCSHLLKIGGREDLPFDNYSILVSPHDLIHQLHFRNTLAGIIEYTGRML